MSSTHCLSVEVRVESGLTARDADGHEFTVTRVKHEVVAFGGGSLRPWLSVSFTRYGPDSDGLPRVRMSSEFVDLSEVGDFWPLGGVQPSAWFVTAFLALVADLRDEQQHLQAEIRDESMEDRRREWANDWAATRAGGVL